MRIPQTRPFLCAVLALSLGPSALHSQQDPTGPEAETDWRMPFRSPDKDWSPPADVFRQLRSMYTYARKPDAKLRFNEDGIEICEDPLWNEAYMRLLDLRQDAGWISQIIRISGSVEDREVALYGMFYNPDRKLVMQMLNHIPGEPVRRLRQDAMRRAMEFLRVHYPAKNEGDLEEWSKIRVGPAGELPPKPGEYSHELDEVPYFALLQVGDSIDQRQALWFLGELVKMRPALWQRYLAAAGPILYELLVADDVSVRTSAREFLMLVDPAKREAPSVDAPKSERLAWIDAVMYDVFPPIRRVSPGQVDLYKSDDLDQLLEIGERLLREASLGDTAMGAFKNGQTWRGVQLKRLPTPLDKLGLEIGHVVTAINGVPVGTCADILRIFTASGWKRSFFVEFVDGEKSKAMEYRRAN